jgi:hypothetical protein
MEALTREFYFHFIVNLSGLISGMKVAVIIFYSRASWVRSRKPRLKAMGIHCADHATPSTHKGWRLSRQAAVALSV